MTWLRKHWPLVLAAFIVAIPVAYAGAIKTWTAGDILRVADLNSNFSHIHNDLRGGSHTAIVNADISASAGIAHSKLANADLLPKITALVNISATPTIHFQSPAGSISSVTKTAVGNYTVNLAAGRTDNIYGVVVTPSNTGASVYCTSYAHTTAATTAFKIYCFDGATPSNADPVYIMFALYDNDG